MHSRAYLLIEKEFDLMKFNPIKGIEAKPAFQNSFFHWIVTLQSLPETPWEGGIFKLSVQFGEEFNDLPPLVHFLTIPFHPNVDPTNGYVALDCLMDVDQWSPGIHLGNLFQRIQELLSSPSLRPDTVVNADAAELLTKQPDNYRRLIVECVTASQKLDAIDEDLPSDAAMTTGPKKRVEIEYDRSAIAASAQRAAQASRPRQAVANVNFEQYLTTWCGIATSKSTSSKKNPHLEMIAGKPNLISIHHCVKFDEIENQLVQQVEQHRSLMYGNISRKSMPTDEAAKSEKLEQIENMRRIYISQKTQSTLSRPTRESTMVEAEETAAPINTAREEETEAHDEEEVEELVAWTEQLDHANL